MKYQNDKDLIANIKCYWTNLDHDLWQEIRERLEDLEAHPEHIPYVIDWTSDEDIVQTLNSIGYTIVKTEKHIHLMKITLKPALTHEKNNC